MADFGAPSDNENAIRSRQKKISVFPVPMSTISPISKVQLQKKFLLARPKLYGTYKKKKFFLVVLDRLFLLSFRDGVLVWGENSVFLLVTYTCK